MAVSVFKSDLTPSQISQIRKYLFMQPLLPTVPLLNRYDTTPKPPILFYLTQGDQILLPYIFASALLQKPVNQELNHPRCRFEFKGELYEHQIPIAQEALNHIQTKGTTTLGLPCGQGKTVYGAYLASQFGLYTVVLCNREFLGNQWAKTFEEFTSATTWIVPTGEIKFPQKMPHITLCMDSRVENLPWEYRARIGLMIIDEADTLCTPSRVPCLLGFQPRHVIAETATLTREDGMHTMIQAICGTHGIFKTSNKAFTVVKLQTAYEPETKKTVQGRLDYNALCQTLAESDYCNRVIVEIIRANPERKILVLTSRIDQVNYLHEKLTQLEEHVDKFAGNKKSYRDSRILIGTIPKIGVGFDERNACPDFNGIRLNLLILASSIKANSIETARRLEQSIGRILRSENPIVIDIVHDNSTLKSHWYKRRPWYISRNATIHEVKLSGPPRILRTLGGELVHENKPQTVLPPEVPIVIPQISLHNGAATQPIPNL